MSMPQLPVAGDLAAELWTLLNQAPPGRVTTYGQLARALGDVAASRWVGEQLLHHEHTAECACHRVVRAGGELGRFVTGEVADKQSLLEAEGIEVRQGRVDVSRVFGDFKSSAPLRSLKEFQETVPSRLTQRPSGRRIETVAGIDVAYVAPGEAVAACVLVDRDSLETVWSTTVRAEARFPYIPGYLAFRELDVMLEVWKAAARSEHRVDLVLIDGNGILHPRRAGIGSCFGLLAGVPTIGIGKKLLCGQVDLEGMSERDERPVVHNEELVGAALKCRADSRPIFVSPGDQIDVAGAARLVRELFDGHRLPEPLHRADRLSKDEARRLKT